MSGEKGKIVVIVAPSGSGKSTLIKRLKRDFPHLIESVSYTTRPRRDGEISGEHYHFISKEEFEKMMSNDEFLEWAIVHDNYYGTSKKFVQKMMEKGENLLFDLDIQGTDSFKVHFEDDVKAIFIAPPSIEELESRLRSRGTESTGVIQIRIENSKKEILRKDDYDYCVVNDELERAYAKLKSIVSEILN